MKTLRYWIGMIIFIIMLPLIIPIGYMIGKGLEGLIDILIGLIT